MEPSALALKWISRSSGEVDVVDPLVGWIRLILW